MEEGADRARAVSRRQTPAAGSEQGRPRGLQARQIWKKKGTCGRGDACGGVACRTGAARWRRAARRRQSELEKEPGQKGYRKIMIGIKCNMVLHESDPILDKNICGVLEKPGVS
jgi:hypothetical protein